MTVIAVWGYIFLPRTVIARLDLGFVRGYTRYTDQSRVTHEGVESYWNTQWASWYDQNEQSERSALLSVNVDRAAIGQLKQRAPGWAHTPEKPQKPNDILMIVSRAHGWPFRGAVWHDRQTLHNYLSDSGPRGISSKSESVWVVRDRYFLPLQPIWTGLLANLFIYAFGAYALLTVLAIVRATLRKHRGRCPRCAYDLRHALPAGCPECGWNRQPTNVSPPT